MLLIPAAFVAGLQDGGWRTPLEAAREADPRIFVHGLWQVEPPAAVATRWLLTAALAFTIALITWAWRGGTAGYGVFAACAAFTLSLLIELARWLKPGQWPDIHAPLIVALMAPVIWRLLSFLPYQPVTPLPRYGAWRTRIRIMLRFLLAGGAIGVMSGGLSLVSVIEGLGYAPAQFAPVVETLPDGRAGITRIVTTIITKAFDWTGLTAWLKTVNRIDPPDRMALPAWAGARGALDGVLPEGRLRQAASIETLRQAIESAEPGDVILLQPGTYRLRPPYLTITRPGTAEAPIVLRAPNLGSVIIESEAMEAIKAAAPYWRFENLVLRGVCADDSACDNAFHIAGDARGIVLRNGRIEDFNAQIKINQERGRFPDGGRIEHMTLINTHARRTEAPVTPIDLVAANDWVIEDNLIADFVKLEGNAVSYGAFAKGGAHGTIFRRNVILCEWRLSGLNGQRIGLSFGGGGTGSGTRRDLGVSGLEHLDGLMTDNLIAFCSDDGIYLNRAANSIIRNNTLIGTSGIDVRYQTSTALVEANLIDGPIRSRNGGMFRGDDNEASWLPGMFLGRNPVRSLFVGPGLFDLRWRRLPTLVGSNPGIDLCGEDRRSVAPPGAFSDFRACGVREKP